MFSCPSCLSSCLRAVAPDLGTSLPRTRRASAIRALSAPSNPRPRNASSSITAGTRSTVRGTDGRPIHKPGSNALTTKFKPSHLKKEVERLADPAKLAQKTLVLLGKGDEDRALELIRLAGNQIYCVVSWNHMLNHILRQNDVKKAWSLFNEMKKRGQKPDAFTYTIMLNGLASNASNKVALERAETIYNSMYAPNSPVRPNLTHVNAMLKVCARAHDLHKMFEIAASIPTSGRGAADTRTFATVLNAIRVSVEEDSYTKDPDARREKKEQTILQAKRIWADVIQRWTDGELLLDEHLVCAMGQILLMVPPDQPTEASLENADDVLSLVEQAIGIPREIPRRHWRDKAVPRIEKPVENREVEDPQSEVTKVDPLAELDRGASDPSASKPVETIASTTEDYGGVFDPVAFKNGSIRQYARPNEKTLTLILRACAHSRGFTAGTRYWEILGQEFPPDLVNCNDYLRLLRYQHSSRLSARLVRKMRLPRREGGYGVGVLEKTFIMAMSACSRDIKNKSVLQHATSILEDMEKGLETPSLKAISLFDQVLKSQGRKADHHTAVTAVKILERMGDNLRSAHAYGDFDTKAAMGDEVQDEEPVGNDPAELKISTESTGGRLMDASRNAVLYIAKVIEGAISRTIDYFGEEMGAETNKELRKSLQNVRTRRLRMVESDQKMSKTRKRTKGDSKIPSKTLTRRPQRS